VINFHFRSLPHSVIYLFFVFLFLLALNSFRPVRSFRGLAERTLVIPAKEKIYDLKRFFKKDLAGCWLENEREIAELKTKIASLSEENREQKRLLAAPLPKNWQFLTVKVIGIAGETVTLGAGRNEGVKENMILLFGNTYLGKVRVVSESISQVRLLSFYDEKLAVKIVSKEGEILGRGLLVGKGEGKMKIEQILYPEGIQKGNLVITSVEDGELLIGEIEEIIEKKGEVFKTALVKRLYNPEELNTVFLIRGRL